MLLVVPQLLHADRVAEVRRLIDGGRWEDGKGTAGRQSALAKRNRQIAADCERGDQARRIVLEALQADGLFLSAALPKAIFPPLFNRYDGDEGHAFGNHVDNAIRFLPDGSSLRTDLSATLFLSAPEDYDGGELVIEDSYGAHEVKLAAVVVAGVGEEYRGGQVGADRAEAVGEEAYGIVDMVAEGMPLGPVVAVEQRRDHRPGQCCGHEKPVR